MSLNSLSVNELLTLASESNDIQTLKSLARNPHMNVRRAVARNNYITADIANLLSTDPVLNVSYMANKNHKSTLQRSFNINELTSCIMCEIKESQLECSACEGKNKDKF